MPESHDDTLDFSIEPASLAAVAANEDSAWQFCTALRVLILLLEGAMRALVRFFPRLAHKTARWISVLSLLPSLL